MGASHGTLVRFSISLDKRLLRDFDASIGRIGHRNRSEAIRDLIRDMLVREKWRAGTEETVGVVTLVYSHDSRTHRDLLADVQHRYLHRIVSTMHVHLDRHNCLEVLVIRGKGAEIQKIADRLIGIKGVKHGKLSLTTTGKDLV